MKTICWFLNQQCKLGLMIIMFFFLALFKVIGFPLPEGFVPYIDIGEDIGKKGYIYCAPVGTIVEGFQQLIYDGVSISPGIKYYIPKIPVALQISLFRGVRQMSESYGSGSFEISPYKKFENELTLGFLYLRNLNRYHNHYGFSGYFNWMRKGKAVNLGSLTGIYNEQNKVAYKIGISEYELFLAEEITLTKWFICPYFNFALIYRIFSQKTARRDPEKALTNFISIGVRIQLSGKSYISNLINKIIAPKSWRG